MTTRRFPPPWKLEQTPGGWKVVDATGRALAYTYGSDESRGINDDRLTLDEARRIAVGITRLPELLQPASPAPPSEIYVLSALPASRIGRRTVRRGLAK